MSSADPTGPTQASGSSSDDVRTNVRGLAVELLQAPAERVLKLTVRNATLDPEATAAEAFFSQFGADD